MTNGNIIIIGAGVVGLSSAYYLNKAGYKVTILEQGSLTSNCSSGNAGMIVPSHFIPLAAPGMISQGIKWMFNSRSPFYVKPSLSPALLCWGIKFWQHANDKHVARSAVPLRDLHLFSKELYHELAAQPGFDFGLQDRGILMLYKKESTAEEEMHVARKAQDLGLDVDILDAAAVQQLEPHTRVDVLGGVHYRCDAHLSPSNLVQQLEKYLTANGVDIHYHTPVKGFKIVQGKVKTIETESRSFEADAVVMTGGAWLPELAKKAGLNISLMPGKGYSFMVDPQDKPLVHPSLLLEARVAVTPMNEKIRFGGTMEIAPVSHHINMNRVKGIVQSIPDYYPEHRVELPAPENIWYGFRPCSPDGLPYLGRSHKVSNLLVAGGHGMMGLSLAPASGKIIAELIQGSSTSVSIDQYKPDRF